MDVVCVPDIHSSSESRSVYEVLRKIRLLAENCEARWRLSGTVGV
jgi:hypothetical protein